MTPNYLMHAEGSVLIEAGNTRVICTASVEDRVPGFLRNTGKGWVNGEKLCHKWKQWFSGELKCLRIARDGRLIHWTSLDGDTGTATIVALPPRIEIAAVALPPPTIPLPLVQSPAARPLM